MSVRIMSVPETMRGKRLDFFLSGELAALSRERVKKTIREGGCLVDGLTCLSPAARLAPGQRVSLRTRTESPELTPKQGEIDLVWHDDDLAVLDKPAGLTVHPCPSCSEATLAHRLLARFPCMARMEGQRPGIVHRLDKDTSGLLVAALNEESRLKLAASFAAREVEKEYLALTHGVPNPRQGDITGAIGRHHTRKTKMALIPENQGGKPARSSYTTLYADPAERFSLLKIRIFTGRTHQIRVHLASIGHPLHGDRLYGPPLKNSPIPRQMLHAHALAFPHPRTGAMLRFTRRPPADFSAAATLLARRLRPLILVGAPGSGKSGLLDLLEKSGLPCFSADAATRRLYERGRDGWLCLHRRYAGAFTPDGRNNVDRERLFAAMRDDPRILREVQEMIHPLVFHELDLFWRMAASAGHECAAAEIPLYLESGGQIVNAAYAAPLLVAVYCEDDERRRRLAARGWDAAKQTALDAWQWSQERKMERCDFIVDNSASLEKLDAEAKKLLSRIAGLGLKEEAELDARLTALWT